MWLWSEWATYTSTDFSYVTAFAVICWGKMLCSSPSLCRGPRFFFAELSCFSLMRSNADSWEAQPGSLGEPGVILLGVWWRVFEISVTVGRNSSESWSAIGYFCSEHGKCRNQCYLNRSGLHIKSFLLLAFAQDQCEEQYALQGCKQCIFVTSLLEEASAIISLPKERGLQPGNGVLDLNNF